MKKNSTFSRLCAALLALVLVIGCVPVSARAAVFCTDCDYECSSYEEYDAHNCGKTTCPTCEKTFPNMNYNGHTCVPVVKACTKHEIEDCLCCSSKTHVYVSVTKPSDLGDGTHGLVCLNCGDKDEIAAHAYENGVCVCGAEEPATTEKVSIIVWDGTTKAGEFEAELALNDEDYATEADVVAAGAAAGYTITGSETSFKVNGGWMSVFGTVIPTTEKVSIIVWNGTTKAGEFEAELALNDEDYASEADVIAAGAAAGYTITGSETSFKVNGGWMSVFGTVIPTTEKVSIIVWDGTTKAGEFEADLAVNAEGYVAEADVVAAGAAAGYTITGSETSFKVNGGWMSVFGTAINSTVTATINFVDAKGNFVAQGEEIEIPEGSTEYAIPEALKNSTVTGANDGKTYRIVGDTAEVFDSGEALFIDVVVERSTQDVVLNYFDEDAYKQAKEVTIEVAADAQEVSDDDVRTNMPQGYDLLGGARDNVIRDGNVYIGVKLRMKDVIISYVCNGAEVDDGSITIPEIDTTFHHSILTDIPQGYELVLLGDYYVGAAAVVEVEVRLIPTTKDITVIYVCSGEEMGTEVITLPIADTTFHHSILTDIPQGYELVLIGDYYAGEETAVEVEVRLAPTTKDITVIYVCGDEEVGTEVITLPIGATTFNYNVLTDIPEGYEQPLVGDHYIGEAIETEIQVNEAAPETKDITLRYVNEETNKKYKDVSVTVPADTKKVSAELVAANLPEGFAVVKTNYKINLLGRVRIIIAEIEAETVEAVINYVDADSNLIEAGAVVEIKADDATFPTEGLTAPRNYEIVGSLGIVRKDEDIYVIDVEVEQVAKDITLRYVNEETNKKHMDVPVTVPVDAEKVDAALVAQHMPEDFQLVKTNYKINSLERVRIIIAPVEEVVEVEASIRFVNADGDLIAKGGTDKILSNATSYDIPETVEAPENFEVVGATGIVQKDGDDYLIFIQVKQVKQNVTLKYVQRKVSGDETIKTVNLRIGAELNQVSDVIVNYYLPEGYELKSTNYEIQNGVVYVSVEEGTKTVTLKFYVHWNDKENKSGISKVEGADKTVQVPYSSKTISVKNIELPKGYRLATVQKTLEISDSGICIVPIQSEVDPDKIQEQVPSYVPEETKKPSTNTNTNNNSSSNKNDSDIKDCP